MYARWFVDEDESEYDVQIYNYSALDESYYNQWVIEYFGYFANMPSQDINGVVVYNISADSGKHIGDTRYVASLEMRDSKTVIAISTPDMNETVKMISTLKLK